MTITVELVERIEQPGQKFRDLIGLPGVVTPPTTTP